MCQICTDTINRIGNVLSERIAKGQLCDEEAEHLEQILDAIAEIPREPEAEDRQAAEEWERNKKE